MNTNISTPIYLPLLCLLVFGFLSAVTQLNYLQIAAFVFSGNEITISIILGHWLVFTSIGSFLSAKYHQHIAFNIITFTYSLFTIIFYLALFFARQIFHIENFLIVSTDKIFLISLLVLAVPTTVNGFLFPVITKKILQSDQKIKINIIYGIELLGAALGSLVFTLWLVSDLNSFLLLIMANILFLFFIILRLKYKLYLRLIIFGTVIVIFLVLALQERQISANFYKNFQLHSKIGTPEGIITVLSTENNLGVYSDNVFIYNSESIQQAEETVHFSLSIHPNPQKILILGNINPLLMAELKKYKPLKSVVYFGHNKPQFDILFKDVKPGQFPFQFNAYFGDPYELVRNNDQKFDVIILNVPEPTNIRWNRYYTLEFFRLLKRSMNSASLMDFKLSASETFVTGSEQDFLKTIHNTLTRIFQNTIIIPGETVHFISSHSYLDFKLHDLEIKPANNHFINEYYLSDRLSEFKINFLKHNISQSNTQQINTLFKPIGFYYSTVMWGRQTAGFLSKLYQKLHNIPLIQFYLVFLLLAGMVLLFQKRRVAIAGKMIFFGFFVMAQESLLILLYQSLSGAVYLRTSLIIFLFMSGAALSSLCYYKIHLRENLIFLLAGLINLTGLLIIFFNFLVILINPAIFLTGFISGQVFPLLIKKLNDLNNKTIVNTGKLYACDVLGGSLGLFFISIIVIPVWGFFPAFLIIQIFLLFFSLNSIFYKV